MFGRSYSSSSWSWCSSVAAADGTGVEDRRRANSTVPVTKKCLSTVTGTFFVVVPLVGCNYTYRWDLTLP